MYVYIQHMYCQQFDSKTAASILSRVAGNMTVLYNAAYYYDNIMVIRRTNFDNDLKLQIASKLLLNVIIP